VAEQRRPAYIPDGEDAEAAEAAIADNLMLRFASPKFLLAMKLAADRDRDTRTSQFSAVRGA